jgi:hypothetical protein
MRYVAGVLSMLFLFVGIGTIPAGYANDSTIQTAIGYVIIATGIALAFMTVCWPSKDRGHSD